MRRAEKENVRKEMAWGLWGAGEEVEASADGSEVSFGGDEMF